MFSKTKTNINKILIALILIGLIFVFSTGNVLAATGINKKINFQGKVTNTDGTNVATGSYNFVFSIYSQQAPGGSVIWTETKSITVTDGIFQTNLGDTTALPGSVDFNTDNIFLGINFNANGEMTPRVQFTASPYSFNSDMLDGKDWTNPGTIGTSSSTLGLASNGASSWTNTSGNLTFSTATSGTLALTSAGALNLSAGAASTATLANVANAFNFDADTLSIDALNNRIGIGTNAPLAFLDIIAPTAASASLRLRASSAVNPSTPNIGDMWFNGTNLYFRKDGSTSQDLLAAGGGMTNPMTTAGDLIYAGASGTPTRLGEGTNDGYVLKINTATHVPYWSADLQGGGSTWTLASNVEYLTTTTEDFAVGGTTLASPFSVDVSLNTARIGSGSTNNAILNMYGSGGQTGSITYTTSDAWDFTGGYVQAPSYYIGGYRMLSSVNSTSLSIGAGAGDALGNYNVLIGNGAGQHISTETGNTFIGSLAAMWAGTGSINNVCIGGNACFTGIGASNVAIGFNAGSAATGGGNVYIGNGAGGNQTDSNKLFIANSNTASPLIWGDFTSSFVNVNGKLGVNVAAPGAFLDITAPTTAAASLRLRASSSVDPSAPNIGDLWFNGANLYFRKDGSTSQDLLASAGGSTLQGAYDTTSGNVITTTNGRNLALTLAELATPTTFSIENQDTAGTYAQYIKNSIASGTLGSGITIEQTGAGAMTNAITILETAGTITTGINIGNNVGTGISIGTGVTTGISIGSGGITIAAGALAVNSDSITSDGVLVINSATSTDIQDALTVDSLTADTGGISIAAGQSYTGAGATTFSSAAGTGLTINSGTTGTINIGDDGSAETINIGTGTAVKTLVIGSLNTTSGVTIQSGTTGSGIALQANGTSTGNVQIGTGGAGSTTPDLFGLDVKSDAGDPAGTPGDMYYNDNAGKFRCYQGAAWTDCIGAGGGGGPIGADTQIAFNDAGTESGDAGLTFNKTTQVLGLNGTNAEINMTGVTTEPSPSAAGTLTTYAKSIGGRMMPKWIGPSGVDTSFQPFIGMNHISFWGAGGGTTVSNLGYAVVSATGTATALANNTTNLYGSMTKVTYRVTTAATTAVAGARGATAQWHLSNEAGKGGFYFVMRGGPDTGVATATSRFFMGMSASTAAPIDVEPSTIANQIGLGYDAADASLQIITRNATTLTKINLNTVTGTTNWNVPTANNTDMYELVLFAPPNTTTIDYRVTNLITGAQYSSSASTGPAVNTLLAPRIWSSVGGTSSVIGVALVSMYLESDY